MLRKLLAVAAVAMAIMSVQGVASAAPSPQKELCKNGGYADYVDPTTNLPFKNQDQCVSFVNHGGVLAPVERPAAFTVVGTYQYEANEWGDCWFAAFFTGPEGDTSSHPYYWLIDGVIYDAAEFTLNQTGPTGLATRAMWHGSTAVLVIDDREIITFTC